MGKPVVHFEVIGSNAKELHKFYGDLFEWTIHVPEGAPGSYGLVHTEAGKGIDGGVGESEQVTGVFFYVEVDDPQATLDQAEQLGGKVTMPVTTIPGMVTMAQFSDPQGNVVGIVAAEQPPA